MYKYDILYFTFVIYVCVRAHALTHCMCTRTCATHTHTWCTVCVSMRGIFSHTIALAYWTQSLLSPNLSPWVVYARTRAHTHVYMYIRMVHTNIHTYTHTHTHTHTGTEHLDQDNGLAWTVSAVGYTVQPVVPAPALQSCPRPAYFCATRPP